MHKVNFQISMKKKTGRTILIAGGLILIILVSLNLNGSLFFGYLKILSNSNRESLMISPIKIDVLRSALFKNNSTAAMIVEKNIGLDINNPYVFSQNKAIFRSTVHYSTMLGLYLIGYQFRGDFYSMENAILLLEKFKKNKNLPISTIIDKKTLLLLDQAVYEKELQISNYSSKMGNLANNVSLTDQLTLFPNDYVAWLFLYPMEVLPEYLQTALEPSNYFLCIHRQCTGTILKNDGSLYEAGEINVYNYQQLYNSGNFLFSADILELPQKSLKLASVNLHEYSHYLDDNANAKSEKFGMGIVDTIDFLNISFNMNERTEDFTNCYKRKTNNIQDFISRYGYDGANSLPCKDYGPEYGAPKEDFAESFTAYVLAGEAFRKAAMQNNIIKEKYDWLKDHVFKGREYSTNLPYAGSYEYDGCPEEDVSEIGGPHYLSCNPDFVWDGKIGYQDNVKVINNGVFRSFPSLSNLNLVK